MVRKCKEQEILLRFILHLCDKQIEWSHQFRSLPLLLLSHISCPLYFLRKITTVKLYAILYGLSLILRDLAPKRVRSLLFTAAFGVENVYNFLLFFTFRQFLVVVIWFLTFVLIVQLETDAKLVSENMESNCFLSSTHIWVLYFKKELLN